MGHRRRSPAPCRAAPRPLTVRKARPDVIERCHGRSPGSPAPARAGRADRRTQRVNRGVQAVAGMPGAMKSMTRDARAQALVTDASSAALQERSASRRKKAPYGLRAWRGPRADDVGQPVLPGAHDLDDPGPAPRRRRAGSAPQKQTTWLHAHQRASGKRGKNAACGRVDLEGAPMRCAPDVEAVAGT
jgi:hypothetical protein